MRISLGRCHPLFSFPADAQAMPTNGGTMDKLDKFFSKCSEADQRSSWALLHIYIFSPIHQVFKPSNSFPNVSMLIIVHRVPFCSLWEHFCSIRQVLIAKSKNATNMWGVYFHLHQSVPTFVSQFQLL